MNKYNARKTVVDGIKFDSKKEANRYLELKLLAHSGTIMDLRLQVPYILEINGVALLIRSKGYPNGRKVKYLADFTYYDNNKRKTIIEDVKGMKTQTYKLKKAIMEAMGHEIIET